MRFKGWDYGYQSSLGRLADKYKDFRAQLEEANDEVVARESEVEVRDCHSRQTDRFIAV